MPSPRHAAAAAAVTAQPRAAAAPSSRALGAAAALVWALYALNVAVHVAALAVDAEGLAAPSKLTLMPLLGLAAALSVLSRRAGHAVPGRGALALLLAAVGLSWLGDGAATFTPFLPTLPAMLGFFGLAHLAYIVLFWRRLAVRRPGWAVAWLPVWWLGMVVLIAPHAGALAVAVAAYGMVLACTCAASRRGPTPAWWGGIAFLLSDSILALRLFLPDMPHWTSPAVMLSYGLGQGLLVWAACRGLSSLGRAVE